MIRVISFISFLIMLSGFASAQNSSGKPDSSQTGEPQKLKEVEIVSRRAFMKQLTDRIVINIADLVSNQGANAVDALNSAPGIFVEDNGSISIKGKDGATILIDDKPTHLSAADLMNYLKTLPAGMLDKIEIMSNPPAKYNASGASGIINIITKKNQLAGFNGNLMLGYGRGQKLKTNNSININYKIKSINFFASAGYSKLNNYFDVERQRNLHSPEFQYSLNQNNNEINSKTSFNYRLGLDYDLNKGASLSLLFNGFNSPYTEQGDYTSRFKTLNSGQDSSLISKSDLETHAVNSSFNLNYIQKLPGDKNELRVNLDYLDYYISSDQLIQSESYLTDLSLKDKYSLLSQNPFETHIYSAKVDYSNKIFNIDFDAGIQSTLSNRSNKGRYFNLSNNKPMTIDALNNEFYYRENISSGYISLNKKLNLWTIQTGIRAEQTIAKAKTSGQLPSSALAFNLNYFNIFPTFYLSYKTDSSSRNSFNFSMGQRITRPNYQDLNPSMFFFDRNTSNRGNPLLKPDYSTNAELNYSYLGKHILGFSFSSTRDKLTRVYKQIDGSFILMPTNIDKVTSYGINITSTIQPVRWLSSNIYAELIHTKYFGTVLVDEFLDNRGTALSISGNNQFKLSKALNAEISGIFRGERILGQGVYKPVGQINMAIQKRIINGNGTLSLTARDIFHTWILRRELSIPYVDVISRNINDTRQFIFAFSYRFGKAFNSRDRKTGIQSEVKRAGAN